MVFEEFEGGHRVGMAMHAGASPDLVCEDTGCNRVILIDMDDMVDYQPAINAYLRTAQSQAQLTIAGRGMIGECSVLHIPAASANLMSSKSIVEKECQIIIGQDVDSGRFHREIVCRIDKKFGIATKVIEAIQFNDLWWITKAQMCDILLRGGLTVEDLPIKKQIAEAYYLLHNGVKLTNGHDAETEEDYAIHYREMQADLDEIEQRSSASGAQ